MKKKGIGLFMVALAGVVAFFLARRQAQPLPQSINVGYTYDQELALAMWYPSMDTPTLYDYDRTIAPGLVAINGAVYPDSAPYPVILFSHGAFSNALQSAFITQYLAKHGYIVVAPDHHDPVGLPSGDPFADFPNRPTDIIATIDSLIAMNKDDPTFRSMIKESAIGISGHSLGGWSSQVAVGAVHEPYTHYKDNRIKAALLFAPNTNTIPVEDFPKIDVPIMYMIGENDQQHLTPPFNILRRIGYDLANSPKYLPLIKDAGHLDFTDVPCQPYNTIEDCWAQDTKARVILKYALAFADRYIKGDRSAEDVLKSDDARLLSYEYEG